MRTLIPGNGDGNVADVPGTTSKPTSNDATIPPPPPHRPNPIAPSPGTRTRTMAKREDTTLNAHISSTTSHRRGRRRYAFRFGGNARTGSAPIDGGWALTTPPPYPPPPLPHRRSNPTVSSSGNERSKMEHSGTKDTTVATQVPTRVSPLGVKKSMTGPHLNLSVKSSVYRCFLRMGRVRRSTCGFGRGDWD